MSCYRLDLWRPFICCCLIMVFFPCFALADCPDSKEKLLRPDSEFLEEAIREGRSFISKRERDKVADVLGRLDRYHLSRVSPSIIITQVADQQDWVQERTRTWKWAPASERAILATLSLQLDMMQILLFEANAEVGEQFFRERHTHRILGEKDRFFKDGRDEYIAEILARLKKVDSAQQLLGCRDGLDLHFPSEAKDFTDVVIYLIDRFEATLTNSQTMP